MNSSRATMPTMRFSISGSLQLLAENDVERANQKQGDCYADEDQVSHIFD